MIILCGKPPAGGRYLASYATFGLVAKGFSAAPSHCGYTSQFNKYKRYNKKLYVCNTIMDIVISTQQEYYNIIL